MPRYAATLAPPRGEARVVRFDSDLEDEAQLEQQVYDTLAREDEWIQGPVRRVVPRARGAAKPKPARARR